MSKEITVTNKYTSEIDDQHYRIVNKDKWLMLIRNGDKNNVDRNKRSVFKKKKKEMNRFSFDKYAIITITIEFCMCVSVCVRACECVCVSF